MANIIRHRVEELFLSNKALLLFNLAIFCFASGLKLDSAISMKLNVYEYILCGMVDHYYVIFCMVPVCMSIFAVYFKKVSDAAKIRFKRKSEIIKIDAVSLAVWFSMYTFIHLSILFFTGIVSLDMTNQSVMTDVQGGNDIFSILKSYEFIFGNAILSILVAWIYMILGFFTAASILSYINVKYGTDKVFLSATFIFVTTFIGFKSGLSFAVPPLFWSNYILFHHGFIVNGNFYFIFTLLCSLSAIFMTMRRNNKIMQRHAFLKEFIMLRRMRITGISISVMIVLSGALASTTVGHVDWVDVSVAVMSGTGETEFSFMGWLKNVIIYMTPIFLIGTSISNFKDYAIAPVYLRTDKKRRLLDVRNIEYFKFTLMYALVLFGIMISVFALGKGSFESSVHYKILEDHSLQSYMSGIFIFSVIVFFIQMMFNVVVFIMLSEKAGEINAFSVLTLISFLPALKVKIPFIANIGFINVIEGMGSNMNPFIVQIAFTALTVGLYTVVLIRRNYGSHKNEKRIKEV